MPLTIKDLRLPIINMTPSECKFHCWKQLQEPNIQRKLAMVVVSIALLLDNMLYMVIVPIIPDYLRLIGTWKMHEVNGEKKDEKLFRNLTDYLNLAFTNHTNNASNARILVEYEGEDSGIGILFASKAAIQIFIGPLAGAAIDCLGYDLPMLFGLTIMFSSTLLFAVGNSYQMLVFARSLQGVGSAFADTGGLAMIADKYSEENERSRSLGMVLAFISLGCLVAPPFGGVLYEFAGKGVPFVLLALVCLLDGLLLLLISRPTRAKTTALDSAVVRPAGTSMWRLLVDPHIACSAGALVVANVSFAFLEPTLSKWMSETMDATEWQQGLIWLPAFLPHLAGVVFTIQFAKRFPEWMWALAGAGLTLESLSCFLIPFCDSYFLLMLPIGTICFGVALIDTSLLPMLGYIVDNKYVSVYGSVYAIADIAYCAAYALGPVAAGHIVARLGFKALNFFVAVLSLAYVPVLYYLKDVHGLKHGLKHARDGRDIPESDATGSSPAREYQTFHLVEINRQENGDIPSEEDKKDSFSPTKSLNPFRKENPQNPFRT